MLELLPIDPVLSVEDLRGATMEIGKLTGEITLDHILDQLFKSFCIGK
jgi:tRNA modification GTPase